MTIFFSTDLLFPIFIWTFIFFFYLDFRFPFSIWTFISFLDFYCFFGLLFPFLHKSRSDLGFLPSFLTTTSFRGHRIFVRITGFRSKSYECRKSGNCQIRKLVKSCSKSIHRFMFKKPFLIRQKL